MKIRRSCQLTTTISLAVLGIWIAAFSANGAASTDNKTFHLNVSPNGYPPYLIVDEQEPSGIIWDVALLIADRLDYTLVAVQVPRKRANQLVLDGYVDGTPRAIEWTKQPDRYLFTDPIVNSEDIFFMPSRVETNYESPDDLVSKTLVTHLGFHYPALEPYFAEGKIERFDVSRTRDMFTFVLHGDQFHAAVADRLVGHWILRKEGLQDEFKTSRESISQYGLRIMVSKQWEDFVVAFNKELERIQKNGELDTILSNYR